MNPIKSTLAGSDAAPAVRRLAAALGTDPEQTRAAMAVMIDALTQRLERNTLSRGGLANVVRAIGDPRRKAYLGEPGLIGTDALRDDGNGILGHIVGSKDASRAIAARAARASGLSEEVAEAILPNVAAMMMGEVARAAQGPFDDIMRNIPGLDDALKDMASRRGGSVPDSGRTGRGELGDGGLGGGGIGGGMPNGGGRSGGGNLGGGALPEQRPLPIPGEIPSSGGSRYDDLGDVLERGGFRVPKGGGGGFDLPGNIPSGGGGSLGGIIRALLAALLGFQSRGILSWIIRLVVMRWGWGFLQRILGRVLGRVLLGR